MSEQQERCICSDHECLNAGGPGCHFGTVTAEHSSEEGGEFIDFPENHAHPADCGGSCGGDDPDESTPGWSLTEAEVEAHACCLKSGRCRDEHFHQRDVERILADRLAAVQAERDRAVEALDDYLSDPPLPIGNDVIADAQETTALALEVNRMMSREIDRLEGQLAESTEAAEAAEAERDDLRGRLAAELGDALREAADFIEATSGIGAKGSDYADGWYDALAYALGELRERAALANPSAAQGEGEA